LRPEPVGDVFVRVDEYVSHVTARIPVAGDNEVPGVTRIRLKRIRESLALAPGITEDDDRLTFVEWGVDYSEALAWSVTSVHAPIRNVAPDGTRMMLMGSHIYLQLS